MDNKKLGENASTLYGAPEYPAWDAEHTYRQYDRVSVDGAIYAAKKPSKGVEPFADDGSNWQFMGGTAHVAGDCFTVAKGNGGAVKVSASAINGGTAIHVNKSEGVNTVNADIATAGSLGVVKPDGDSVTVDEDGTIHATPYALPVASAEVLGGVKVGAGLNVNESGVLSASGGDDWVKLDVVATSDYGFTGEVYKKGNILKICAANRGNTTLGVNYASLTTVIEFDLAPVVDTKQFNNANRYFSNYVSYYTGTSSNPIYPYLQIRGNDARTAAIASIHAPAYSNISVPPNCSITCFAILN